MNKLLVIALSLPLVACMVGPEGEPGTGTGDGDGNGDGTGGGGGGGGGSGSGSGISGTISANTTWTGTVSISASTVIAAGVTVTVDPGTTISIKSGSGVSVNVQGILDVQGTKAAPVVIGPDVAGGFHGGFSIPSGGELKLAYANQTGGGITTTGGKATIVDSYLSKASGDFLVMSGGILDMQYSQVGANLGETDTTHCQLHFGGGGNTISITRSNISMAPYGLMFYGGTNAIFTNNNWFGNQIDIDTQPGVAGDVTGSWFDGAAPVAGSGATLTGVGALSATRLTDAGPR